MTIAQQIEIIKKEISQRLEGSGKSWSAQAAADFLGINVGKIRAWEKGQRPQSNDLEILARKCKFSTRWLLLLEGDPFDDTKCEKSPIPKEEFDEHLSQAQREMLTYKRIQTELGMPNEKIAAGIEAIAMGKTRDKKSYCTAEPPADPGYNNIHEPGAGFGRGEKE